MKLINAAQAKQLAHNYDFTKHKGFNHTVKQINKNIKKLAKCGRVNYACSVDTQFLPDILAYYTKLGYSTEYNAFKDCYSKTALIISW